LLGLLLHYRIERGVDAQAPLEHRSEALLGAGADTRVGEQLLLDLLGEIVAAPYGLLGARRGQRARLDGVGFFERDVAELVHAVDDCIAPFPSCLGLVEGIGAHRVADQAGQQDSLTHVQLVDVLAEVGLRPGLESVRVVPEVDGVDIALKDLTLRHGRFEAQGQGRLLDLAVGLLLGAQEGDLDELLGDGGPTLEDAPALDIDAHGPGHGAHVDRAVFVEPVVLGVEHCPLDVVGHLVDRHRDPVLLLVEGGQHAAITGVHH